MTLQTVVAFLSAERLKLRKAALAQMRQQGGPKAKTETKSEPKQETMIINLAAEEFDIVLGALEHYFSCARSTNRDASRYQELADKLKVRSAADSSQPKTNLKSALRGRT
jgi:hypothetical protein